MWKFTRWLMIALFILLATVMIKYKPIYEVYLNGESIGYVKSKKNMESIINSELLVCNNPCAIFSELKNKPIYELKLVDVSVTDEQKIKQKLQEEVKTMYKIYAITLNDETKAYVNTWEEAEKIIADMKNEYADSTEFSIAVVDKYTESLDDISILELAEAHDTISNDLRIIKDEQERIAAATCNGVYLEVKPITGNITSRYGAVESIRDHTHAGLDIAAPEGTPIKATAAGTVSYSGWMGGYGYLIIIDHENGVQTYYGHCSRLYAKKGETVEAGDKIAQVGSTGNSTGNHLHFEIRVNGKQENPQKYLYN